jgi:cell division septum initiation protein DivIVA
MAASMSEMVEAHLMNVKREISTLVDRKNAVEQEIARLQAYLAEGEVTLNEFRKSVPHAPQQRSVQSSAQSVFGG